MGECEDMGMHTWSDVIMQNHWKHKGRTSQPPDTFWTQTQTQVSKLMSNNMTVNNLLSVLLQRNYEPLQHHSSYTNCCNGVVQDWIRKTIFTSASCKKSPLRTVCLYNASWLARRYYPPTSDPPQVSCTHLSCHLLAVVVLSCQWQSRAAAAICALTALMQTL